MMIVEMKSTVLKFLTQPSVGTADLIGFAAYQPSVRGKNSRDFV